MPATQYPEIFAALAEDFKADEVKVLKKGKTIFYVTARTVMNRLDEVLGPENWIDRYELVPNGVVCRLTIRLPDGKKITKVDAGGAAGMSDKGDDLKSAFSDAIKRAAAKFGVGRILYGDGVADYADDQPSPYPASVQPASTLPGPDLFVPGQPKRGNDPRSYVDVVVGAVKAIGEVVPVEDVHRHLWAEASKAELAPPTRPKNVSQAIRDLVGAYRDADGRSLIRERLAIYLDEQVRQASETADAGSRG